MNTKAIEKLIRDYFSGNFYKIKHILGVVEEMKEYIEKRNLQKSTKENLLQLAYLHDIGHSNKVIKTGFYPLDGALFCEKIGCVKEVVDAVMFQSGAFKNVKRNFPDLLEQYHNRNYYRSETSNKYIELITYCELHRSFLGQKISIEEKIEETDREYGKHHYIASELRNNKPSMMKLINRVESYDEF
ncbi:hypothetical protein AAGG74_14915 [Bacillus mexicanus]|uniref:hypothetical protein n=1 Tax=Bacillus mexicanus TaxID=2834415 RepID=UPI003D1F8FBA